MSANPTTTALIATALALPADERLAIIDAIHVSLADPGISHPPPEFADDVQAAWKQEIERRLKEVESGLVSTVPAEVAERAIRSDVRPAF